MTYRPSCFSFIIAFLLFASMSHLRVQAQNKTLAERLGYPADAKLLIVHADDLGMAHSINDATTKAFATGLVNSGSIMMPCSWVPEIAEYARNNPRADLGLHLTLTSEWKNYRWGPLLPRDRVASLLDDNGYLRLTESEAASKAKVGEVEKEIQAQIELARKLGIQPTHLDSHMGTLYQSKELFETLIRVGRQNKLPVRISREWFSRMSYLPSLLKPEDILVDHMISIEPSVTPEGWARFYVDEVKNLKPGLSEIIVHLAYDDAEMKSMTKDHPDWGSSWRQRDFDFFTSDVFRDLIKAHNIKLVSWREIRKLQYGGSTEP
jgi:chitin disaccharide deacetylase